MTLAIRHKEGLSSGLQLDVSEERSPASIPNTRSERTMRLLLGVLDSVLGPSRLAW